MTPSTPNARRSNWLSLVLIVAVVVGGSEAWSWWRSAQAAKQVSTLSQQGSLLMYTTDTCPYCAQARRWLNDAGARWQECNIDQDATCLKTFQSRGSPGVPLLNVNGQWRLGFDPVWVGQALQSSPKAETSPRP